MTSPHIYPNNPDRGAVRRILSAYIGGADLDAIADVEGFPLSDVQAYVSEELARKPVPPLADFVKLQIARLGRLAFAAFDRAERGELKAIDRTLKILDRLDRYHGFSRASPAAVSYGDEERERLLEKVNVIAARLDAEPQEPSSRA